MASREYAVETTRKQYHVAHHRRHEQTHMTIRSTHMCRYVRVGFRLLSRIGGSFGTIDGEGARTLVGGREQLHLRWRSMCRDSL